MKIVMSGLGKMGANMARRLRLGGIEVIGYDRNTQILEELQKTHGVTAATSLPEAIQQLQAPRVIWMMLPAGAITNAAIAEATPLLQAGDVLINGGNSNYQESIAHAEQLAQHGIHFIDAGVSGGIWGLQNGYALMLGGTDAAISLATPVFKALAPAPDQGWLHCGPAGSGHFVKMIHNGLEYGMMQAYAEAFALMRGKQAFNLDLAAVAELWRHGSVVRSWLLDLIGEFLHRDQTLEAIAPYVTDSGEGRWTINESIEQGIPAPVITMALMMRFSSQGQDEFGNKMLAMMRQGFGGHAVKNV